MMNSENLFEQYGEFALAVLVFLAVAAVVVVFLVALYKLISLPLKRRERAETLLDLLETEIEQGSERGATYLSLIRHAHGKSAQRIHALAAYMQHGRPQLVEGWKGFPGEIPIQIWAILEVGARIGDIGKVLPACRKLLEDGVSSTRTLSRQFANLSLLLAPFCAAYLVVLALVIVPKFESISRDLEVKNASPIAEFVFANIWWLVALQLASTAFLVGSSVAAQLGSWLAARIPESALLVTSRVSLLFPWKRLRMKRDFASMLGILLDLGVPEEDAVSLAAKATNNKVFENRAVAVVDDLKRGVSLTQAICHIDKSGEFRWRLENATHAQSGFERTLAGWRESLDARAYQKEQTASQCWLAMLVVLNGGGVALTCIALFGVLTGIIRSAALW